MSNKDIVVAFWNQAFRDQDPEGAAETHLGESYVQQNPSAVDGPQGLVDFVAVLKQVDPHYTAELVRAVGEGDLVATHSRFGYGSTTVAAMDFWRLDPDGRIVEHWDAIQTVPAEARNTNGMF